MSTSRFSSLSVCAVLAAMLFAVVAEAQPPEGGGRQRGGFGQRGGQQGGGFGQRGGFGGPGGPRGGGPTVSKAALLGNDDIKDELKIDEGQSATIAAALDAYRQERDDSRPDRSAFEGISDEERTELFAKMQKDREALTKKTDELLNALLEPDQVTRLDQILVQVRMASGIANFLKSDDIKAKLSVTEEQIAKLDDVEKEARDAQAKVFEEMRAAFGGRGRGDQGGDAGNAEAGADARQKMQETMQKARAKTTEQAMAVLTDGQKAQLDEMKGKAFEFDVRALFSRGGAGGQGGGGRGGAGGQGGGGERRRPAADTNEAI